VLVLTTFQAFLGAITIGLSLFRGSETTLSAHHHAVLSEANSAAAILGQYHARSANAVTTNNTICAGLLGPRFSVEADNISMDESAMIACPQSDHYHRKVCAQYKANKPRAASKLAWIRTQQTTICRALSQMSGKLDGIMSLRALGMARGNAESNRAGVRIEMDDASGTSSPWGGNSFGESCKLASNDAKASNMVGHGFPLLMDLMVPGLPKALIQRAPQLFCAVQGGLPVKLPEIPSVNKSTREICEGLERQARESVAEPLGSEFWSGKTASDFPASARPYLECREVRVVAEEFETRAGRGVGDGLGATFQTWSENRQTRLECTFLSEKCYSEQLPKQSERFLKSLSLPSLSGGETRKPSASNWNHADEFRARMSASQPVDDQTVRISKAMKTIVSFGAATAGDGMRRERDYSACTRWYFADGPGSRFQGVEPARQAFVQGWSHALTSCK